MPDYITREDEPLMVEADAVGASPVNRGVDNGNEDDRRFREMSGAAVAGGIAGLLIAGPIVGLVAAGGAAVLATTQGRAGDVARATGNVAASAGDRVKRINEKHHIVERTGTGLKKVGTTLQKLDKKHKVTETTSKGIIKGCNWISDKLAVKEKTKDRKSEEASLIA